MTTPFSPAFVCRNTNELGLPFILFYKDKTAQDLSYIIMQFYSIKTSGWVMFYEVGILFRVHDLIQSESNHRAAAWKVFMRIFDPQKLANSTLYEGEINEALMDQEKIFCIAIQTFDPQVITAVKAALLHSHESGLMPPEHRFVEGEVTLRFALHLRAQIDQGGRFHSWDKTYVRQDQMLCHETGWGFGETVHSTCTAI